MTTTRAETVRGTVTYGSPDETMTAPEVGVTDSATTTATTTPTTVDDETFAELERYRRELFAHCYRMLGSTHDAEDLVQETYLRAWRAYDAFEHRSSIRTWLYRIATNVCLTDLKGRPRRPLPTGLGSPDTPGDAPLITDEEVPWLEPAPDALVDTDSRDPAAIISARESVRLAFVAAMQHLPPLQRAVLLLRDVLAWKAAEVAEALDTSVAAVNSALQRARATLADVQKRVEEAPAELTEAQHELLDRWVDAFARKDVSAIADMFTSDATWEMPPFVGWYKGPAQIATLIKVNCPGGADDMRLVPTKANGQPAFGLYMRARATGSDPLPEGEFLPFQLQVLEFDRETERVRAVSVFHAHVDPGLFPRFDLPPAVAS